MKSIASTPSSERSPWPFVTMIVAFTLVAGCAGGPRLLRTDVTTFNDWPALPAVRTYAFARTLEYQNSLEVKSYEDVVRDELARSGFTQAPDRSQASLIVTLRPTVTSTHLRLSDSGLDPFWGFGGYGGPYGGFASGFYGGGGYYGRGGGFYGAGPYGPGGYGGYGGYGDGFGNRTVDWYQQRLEVDIDSRADPGKRYYEGKVQSSSRDESMVAVMPLLIRALFADFPGSDGQTRRVDVAIPPR